ncbi:hypothetical protein FACS1894105_13230 [Clostridia bacterium]|nr:hypothetical protein FACS1894105_13230 [Clostridia bacterium]
MAITEMKKILLCASVDEIEPVTRELMWLGAVEINSSAAENALADDTVGTALARFDTGESLGEIDRKIASMAAALDLLSTYAAKSGGLFSPRDNIPRDEYDSPGEWFATATRVADESGAIIKELAALRAEQNRIEAAKMSYLPWIGLDIPLDCAGSNRSVIALGTVPSSIPAEDASKSLAETGADITRISTDEYFHFYALVYHADDSDNVSNVLTQSSFSRIVFRDASDTPENLVRRCETKIADLEREIKEQQATAKALAVHSHDLEKAYDVLLSRKTEIETRQKFLRTENTAVIEGYIPTKAVPKLESKLGRFHCYAETADPDLSDEAEAERVPVLLKNNKLSDPFEFVLGLYSMPKYGTFDPTALMSIFYFVIFGLMLGDFVYGLILTVGTFLYVKLAKPDKGMRQFMHMFSICGIASMIAGLLFGSYLGDLPSSIYVNWMGGEPDTLNLALLFDPISNPMAYLYMSVGIGAVHIFTGMGIKMYRLIKQGKVADALMDVGSWFVVFAGIIVLILGMVLAPAPIPKFATEDDYEAAMLPLILEKNENGYSEFDVTAITDEADGTPVETQSAEFLAAQENWRERRAELIASHDDSEAVPAGPLGNIGIGIALFGVLCLICTQGRREKNPIMKFVNGLLSLYDSVAYVSDLLSYARILAIALAGGVISMVINLLGTMGGFGYGLGIIALLIALAVGHLLNIALSLLGAFVHAARLQYIEFFGKFYENGGKPFTPVIPEPKYTSIANNIEEA